MSNWCNSYGHKIELLDRANKEKDKMNGLTNHNITKTEIVYSETFDRLAITYFKPWGIAYTEFFSTPLKESDVPRLYLLLPKTIYRLRVVENSENENTNR